MIFPRMIWTVAAVFSAILWAKGIYYEIHGYPDWHALLVIPLVGAGACAMAALCESKNGAPEQ